jgi:hypothetical protein
MNDTREHVHAMIDQLDADQLAAIGQLLVVILDPVAHAISRAPHDDEPVTEEDRARVRKGQAFFADRKGIPMEQILSELGLRAEDFPIDK